MNFYLVQIAEYEVSTRTERTTIILYTDVLRNTNLDFQVAGVHCVYDVCACVSIFCGGGFV